MKVQLCARVSEELKRRLEEEAKKRGVTVSTLVEALLADALKVRLEENYCTQIDELRRALENYGRRLEALESEVQLIKRGLPKP